MKFKQDLFIFADTEDKEGALYHLGEHEYLTPANEVPLNSNLLIRDILANGALIAAIPMSSEHPENGDLYYTVNTYLIDLARDVGTTQ